MITHSRLGSRPWSRRTFLPQLERLEERTLLNTAWVSYGHDPQHTGLSAVASQPLDTIRWQTPVDLAPQYSGNELLIHYGSPLITPANTVIIPVRTGVVNGQDQFEVTARRGSDGSLKWTFPTDYILPPHNWTPSFSPTLTVGNRLYFAGAGGTVYYIDNVDSDTPSAPVRLAFYGVANYNADPTAYNNAVFVDTPITADSQGDIFFGYEVTGSNPSHLKGGLARIAADGNGRSVSAVHATGDTGVNKVDQNCAPALSNDESSVYVAVNNGNFGSGYLLELDSTTLATKAKVLLLDPSSGQDAALTDDGTPTPMVGPDGDVYFGVFENPFYNDRGWMLHFSGDLSQEFTPGAFGWDDTASIVPTSMVPGYSGTAPYLIFTKYNNYYGLGPMGDGTNRIAILDPHATEFNADNNFTTMNEVMTILGVTPDQNARNQGYPNAVREWCINDAVVDPATDSILAGSEDGKLYRWNLQNGGSFTQVVTLTSGLGEAYTPTLIGPDGTVYAINNAILFAVGKFTSTTSLTSSANPSVVNQPVTFTATVTAAVGGTGTPTGTVTFKADGKVLGHSAIDPTTGQATFTTSALVAGNHKIRAVYDGDSQFTGGNSNQLVQRVNVAGPEVALGSAAFSQLAPGVNVSVSATEATATAAERAQPLPASPTTTPAESSLTPAHAPARTAPACLANFESDPDDLDAFFVGVAWEERQAAV
jgi:hypothetical protein